MAEMVVKIQLTPTPPSLSIFCIHRYSKLTELVAESIPSSCLQSYALFGTGTEISKTAIFSILVSASSIAYTSSVISIDWDTDTINRRLSPAFYGYLPNQNRFFSMLCMMLMTASHVLMKVIACALMLRVNKVWFFLYLLTDQCLWYGYKIARSDFRYWSKYIFHSVDKIHKNCKCFWFVMFFSRSIKQRKNLFYLYEKPNKTFPPFPLSPNQSVLIDGALSWIVSFLVRTMVKVIVDFTLLVQLRHPLEFGGMYWSFNIIANQAFCFTSVFLYGKFVEDVDEDMLHMLWMTVGGLFAFSMLNFAGFICLINRSHVNTFFSSTSAAIFPSIGTPFPINNANQKRGSRPSFTNATS